MVCRRGQHPSLPPLFTTRCYPRHEPRNDVVRSDGALENTVFTNSACTSAAHPHRATGHRARAPL